LQIVAESSGLREAEKGHGCGATAFEISARRGDGLAELFAALAEFAETFFGGDDGGLIGRERHRELLRNTADMLQRSISAADLGEEIAAEELRAAAHNLGRLLGRVDVEDVLESIFQNFCIGK
jgi:tRNA modification GTPase